MITTEVAAVPGAASPPDTRGRRDAERAGYPGRARRGPRSWGWSIVVSAFAHAGLVGAASLVPESQDSQAPIVIDLVASQELPPPVVVAAPKRVHEAVVAPALPRRPAAVRPARRQALALAPSLVPAPAPQSDAPPTQAPLAPSVDPAVAGDPTSTGPAVAVGGTGTGAGIGGGPAGAPSRIHSGAAVRSASGHGLGTGSLRSYLEQVQARVARGQRYPRMAIRLGLDGVVAVRVRLHPDGTLAAPPAVAASSGHDVLDREALRMVAEAAPYPPLPMGVTRPTELTVPVRFRLEEQ